MNTGDKLTTVAATDRPRQGDVNRWEHFSHIADMGVRGLGRTLNDAFAQAAIALTAIITDPASVEPVTQVNIECQAPDDELLLCDWLNALIYEMATRKMLFIHFDVNIHASHLQATAWGEAIDKARHQPAVEIKGASYTELRVAQLENGTWLAQCVVDV